MKKLKRKASIALAAVLTAVFVFSSSAFVLAANEGLPSNNMDGLGSLDKAKILNQLGIYRGVDKGDMSVGLDTSLTTQDSLLFMSRLFGYEQDAMNLEPESVQQQLSKFEDQVSIDEYAKNVVAYSAQTGVLTGSTQDGKFFIGAKDTVTCARFATFMLRQMGYDVQDYKESARALSEKKGMQVSVSIAGEKELERDDAVAVMYAALTAEKASGKTIVEDLVKDNSELEAKAIEVGLVKKNDNIKIDVDLHKEEEKARREEEKAREKQGFGKDGRAVGAPVVTVKTTLKDLSRLKVSSVKAPNTKQIKINFNTEIDRLVAQNPAHYTVKDDGNVVMTLTDNSCKLSDDLRTVTITLNNTLEDCLTESSVAKVIIGKNIKSAEGKILGGDKEYDVPVNDSVAPTVEAVKAIGKRNIRIIFSEPVWECDNNTAVLEASNFKVVEDNFTYNVRQAKLNNNVIDLETETDLVDGIVKVTVNESGGMLQDYAGNSVLKNYFLFEYENDNTVPTITAKQEGTYCISLTFSSPVKGQNIALHQGSEATATATAEDLTDEIRFVFDEPLPFGAVEFELENSEAEDEKIVNGYGINVPDQTFECGIAEDEDAPVVVACTPYLNERIEVIFDEQLSADSATDWLNYEVTKLSDGRAIPVEVEVSEDMKSVVLMFAGILEDHSEYQLVIREYKDIFGNRNTEDYKYKFVIGEYLDPTVLIGEGNCEWSFLKDNSITIIYSEAMNEAQMVDKDNYMISKNGGESFENLGANDTITKINDRAVLIALGERNIDDSLCVKIASIMDRDGNRLNGTEEPVVITEAQLLRKLGIQSAQLLARDRIKIVFNGKLRNFEPENIVLRRGAERVEDPFEEINYVGVDGDGKTVVDCTLKQEINTNALTEDNQLCALMTENTNSVMSTAYGLVAFSEAEVLLIDEAAPEIVFWDHDGDIDTQEIAKVIGRNFENLDSNFAVSQDSTGTIVIYFSEDIHEFYIGESTFQVDGFTVTGVSAPVGSKTVVLSVKANADNTYVKTSVTQTEEIFDLAVNERTAVPGQLWQVTLES